MRGVFSALGSGGFSALSFVWVLGSVARRGLGTGLGWHRHGAAWSTVVVGLKLWLLAKDLGWRDAARPRKRSTVGWVLSGHLTAASAAGEMDQASRGPLVLP